MHTFTEQEIRDCLADTGVNATVVQWMKSEAGTDEQPNAELCMRTLASALTDPLDLENPQGYGAYVADALAEDVDGSGILADWADEVGKPGVVVIDAMRDLIVKHALDARVAGEHEWLRDEEQAHRDEEADRAYDRARIEGRWPHHG